MLFFLKYCRALYIILYIYAIFYINTTAYENQYKDLLEAITLEHQGKSAVQLCHKHLLKGEEFFSPIWKDILSRQISVPNKNATYPDSHFFYEQINRKRIFLAEFRYWE